MSEDNKFPPPPPPPDDFTKTTPNIPVPRDDSPANDWDKTNYNFPRQPASDDWGKTQVNIKPIDTANEDFGKTFYSGAKAPSTPEWGVTEANINVNPNDFGGDNQTYDKTTPYFQLPEADRAKYQNLPPTPAEKATQAAQEEKEKGGVPGWVWITAGLMTMFFFAIIVLLVVYFFILRDTSFEVTVKGAPPGSTVQVDDRPLGVTDEDGSIKLSNLKAGEREVKVVHPNFTCESRRVTSKDGTSPEPIIARCTAVKAAATDDCLNFGRGDDDKAERCYNTALDALPDPFTAEDLVKALNILIINFDSGKSDVPPIRLAALQKGAGFIKKLPAGIVLEVGGHTDNVGNDTSNQTLSDARSAAVKTSLVKFGVADGILQTRGYGATKPRPDADNSTENGRYRNRRIEYSIVKK